MGKIRSIITAITLGFTGVVFAGTAAHAAITSVTSANVNMRAGPSTAYPAIVVVPNRSTVTTYGCQAGYTWCDVGYGTYRGWVYAPYLQAVYQGQPVIITPAIAPVMGLSVITFNQAYWTRYYRNYPWYGHWNRYYRGPVAARSGHVVGPYGGEARGGTVVGPAGNRARGGAVTGPNGHTAKGGAVCGPYGCTGRVVGPDGRAVGGAGHRYR
ncbi:SH3 domain-containing protein [Flexibacterium corallicola]|uniref:SH3 domain-containing protein n=1 Tax=Flexibacterium corallicola TaxID=3037259 RepID=UPI00286F9CA4|nr:SH3 domain-containing protein [Pseudovibrio sp. M1P-2-3]